MQLEAHDRILKAIRLRLKKEASLRNEVFDKVDFVTQLTDRWSKYLQVTCRIGNIIDSLDSCIIDYAVLIEGEKRQEDKPTEGKE